MMKKNTQTIWMNGFRDWGTPSMQFIVNKKKVRNNLDVSIDEEVVKDTFKEYDGNLLFGI